jgi:DNA polymerase
MPEVHRPLTFHNHPDCRLCPLHESARSVGVGTTCYHVGGRSALIVIGQNPGADEDRAGIPFIGRSGRLLKSVYLDPLLRSGVDPTVYLTNPARCGPDSPVPPRSLRICSESHLIPEVDRIIQHHSRTVLLATGAPACSVLTGHKLGSPWSLTREAFSKQPLQWGPTSVVYFTYHPAAVLRKRTLGHAVADHLVLVKNWLLADTPTISRPDIIPPRPPNA